MTESVFQKWRNGVQNQILIGNLSHLITLDKIGRKSTIVISIIVCGFASAVGSFMPTYWSYALLRMVVGAGSEGCFLVAFTMLIEIVGVRERIPCIPWVTYPSMQGNIVAIPLTISEVFCKPYCFVRSLLEESRIDRCFNKSHLCDLYLFHTRVSLMAYCSGQYKGG